MSMTLMLIGGAIGGLNAIGQNRAIAEAQREQIELNRLASIYKYKATESSVNMMKALNREATENAIREALRAGTENVRQTQTAISKAEGSLQAQQEGLASGASKGRELATMYIKGNKVLDQTKDSTVSQINKLVTTKDLKQNELNNQLLKSYQEMSAVLADEGPEIPGMFNNFVSGLTRGAVSGLAIGNSIAKIGSLSPTTSTILPSGIKGRLPSSIDVPSTKSKWITPIGTTGVTSGIRIPNINYNW